MLETKIDINKTAVLVIDMQNDLVKTEKEPFNAVTKMVQSKGVIGNIARVITAARQMGMLVIFIGHVHMKDKADIVPTITDLMLQGLAPPLRDAMIEGTPGADFVDELKPMSADCVVYKRRSNAFYNSDLELVLRNKGVDTLIVMGAVTDGCVASTVQGARDWDLHIIVLSDCCATSEPEDDEYFLKKVFPKRGRVRTCEELLEVMS